MRTFVNAVICIAFLILLPGCWNAVELDEWGFVQGMAIDRAETGEVELTVQFYKPNTATKGIGISGDSQTTFLNVKTRDESVFEAIRDMTVHVGRKAQWSHMRVLIISDEIAKERDIGELIDYFARDHEPRGTAYIMIGKGRADQYVKNKPFIETSMGQQMREAEIMAYQFAGKTLKTNLLDLALQLRGQTGVAAVPFVYFDPKNQPLTAPVTGLALMKKGKLEFTVPSKRIEALLMLMNKYKGGVIETPCSRDKEGGMQRTEAVEVETAKTKTAVKITGDSAAVHFAVDIRGFVGELVCTTLENPEDMEKFNSKVAQVIEEDLRQTFELLQKQKLDVVGIGNRIFRKDPSLWRKWKPDWEERFATLPYTFEVKVEVINTGSNLGKPLGK